MPQSRTVDLRWNAILNDFRRSGLTHAEFCRLREIPLHTFRKHLNQARTPKSGSSPGNGRPSSIADHHFIPVTLLPDPTPTVRVSRPHLELVRPDGRRTAIAPGIDSETLRRVIAVVEERLCV